MSTPKYIFYLLYFIFHVFLIGGSIYVMNEISGNANWEDGMFNGEYLVFTETNIIIFSVIGMVLFLVNVVMVNIQISSAKKRRNKLENEINSYKAKLYDLQDAQPGREKPTPSGETGDKSGEALDKPSKK